MKTFIVPTDFSPEAENALEYACVVAGVLHARLIIFNSYSFPVHASNARLSAASMESLEEHNKELLQERAARLSAQCDIEISYEYGLMVEVSEELDKIVEKYQGDMVIMGMAPKSLAQELFGNTTTSVIMKQKYPVLAVPLGSRYTGLKKILFACDDLEKVPKNILARIREIAGLLEAEVEVFHVRAKSKSWGASVTAPASSRVIDEGLEGISYYYKNVESDAVIAAIEKEIKSMQADLLIMMPRKYGFWDSFAHRSKTRIMASNNDVPLLSIPLI
jgi:nucleotide-binding universal stress UspA family protein